MDNPPELKGSRRELALVSADGQWRTAKEVSREMGKPTGSIFGVLRRMHTDGLLEADTPVPTRGTQYRLTAVGHAALVEALEQEDSVGQLDAGWWVLVVERGAEGGKHSEFEEVLSHTSLAGRIAWSARFGWGWLLALSNETDDLHVEDLAKALERKGFRCQDGRAEALLSGAQLRERASPRPAVASRP